MGYIFEAEIDSIIHAVRVKTVGENDGIFLKEILSADIHPAIKAYFKAEVEKMLEKERESEYRSKKFQYSLAEIKSLEEQIDLVLIQNYHFSLQEFESLLDESVHFQFNYLCRPQWTMKNFIIGDQRAVSSSIIEKRLMYCVDYTYFPELIKRYIVDHGLTEVTYGEFSSLIEKIDSEVVAQHSSIELAHMTRALFEFVESGKMIPQIEFEQQTLPINAAIVFFDDKHLTDIYVRLEYERDQNRIVQITADRLADIIESVRTGKNEDTEQVSESGTAEDKNENPAVELKPEDSVKENVEEERIDSGLQQKKEDLDITGEASLIEAEDEESQLGLSFESNRERIAALFSDEERDLLTKKVFACDEPAYQGAITELSQLEIWIDVARYLDTLYIANGINPFSKEAILFTDRLSAYFNSSANT